MNTTTTANLRPLITTIKGIFLTTLLAAITLGIASADKKPRDFFAPKGIVVGTPTAEKGGTHRIPIKFKTAIIHSGQWIDNVESSVDGKEIRITVNFRSGGKSRYPGHIELKGITSGSYELKYLDPDGKLHDIGPVTLP